MSAHDDSAVDEPVNVLMLLHDNFDLLDFAGPQETFSHTRQDIKDPNSVPFDITIAGEGEKVMSAQGVAISTQINYKEAYERIEEWDIVVVPGGGSDGVLKKVSEPIPFVRAYVALQEKNTKRERTLFSVCTGSLFLAEAGALQGLAATTHPDYEIQLENICQKSSAHVNENHTDVMITARYVVNNARFDIGDTEDPEAEPNPFIQTKDQYLLSKKERRKSTARRGSLSFRQSSITEESAAVRATKRLGGLRVVTAGGVTSGIDAALYVASAHVSIEAAEEAARVMQYEWQKGVVVDSIDF